MSRSRHRAANEVPTASEVLPRYTEAARRYQYRVVRSKGGTGSAKKLGSRRLRYPPPGGWKGGHPDHNRGFGAPQKDVA